MTIALKELKCICINKNLDIFNKIGIAIKRDEVDDVGTTNNMPIKIKRIIYYIKFNNWKGWLKESEISFNILAHLTKGEKDERR